MKSRLIDVAFAATTTIIAIGAAVHAAGPRDRQQVIESVTPAVTMVISVKREGKKLIPIASGSGTIVGNDGSILTNYHVIASPKTNQLHEYFVVARFRSFDSEPELVCAGRPSFGKLKPSLDLAMIKCDLDLSLRPSTTDNWPTIPIGRSEEMIPGEQVLVLGYPNVGGKTLQVTPGLLSGWMTEDLGTAHRAYMKTDASITHGNSGGAAIDENGKLIGVPSAFRSTNAEQGAMVVPTGKIGLIRPIEHARDLIALARSGWTPSADNEVAETSDASGPDKSGVLIRSTVVDSSNQQPVEGAFVIVFRPEIRARDVDTDELESQTLAFGQANAGGVFRLSRAIKRGQRLTVAILADGYEPLVAGGGLVVPEDAPSQLDPWKIIRIKRR